MTDEREVRENTHRERERERVRKKERGGVFVDE